MQLNTEFSICLRSVLHVLNIKYHYSKPVFSNTNHNFLEFHPQTAQIQVVILTRNPGF